MSGTLCFRLDDLQGPHAYMAGVELGKVHAMMELGLPNIRCCAVRLSNMANFDSMATHYGYSGSYVPLGDGWAEANWRFGGTA